MVELIMHARADTECCWTMSLGCGKYTPDHAGANKTVESSRKVASVIALATSGGVEECRSGRIDA